VTLFQVGWRLLVNTKQNRRAPRIQQKSLYVLMLAEVAAPRQEHGLCEDNEVEKSAVSSSRVLINAVSYINTATFCRVHAKQGQWQ
jgi:hypothetical protein